MAASLEGCASHPLPVTTPTAPLPWTAAIGRLDDDRDGYSCSATLVSPDTIVTAAHCLFFNGRQVDPANLAFTPFVGGGQKLKSSQGTAIIAVGGDVEDGKSHIGDTEQDWGLVKIAPAITTYITPITIADLGADDVAKRMDSGAALSNAGYGVYGIMTGKRLHQHENCKLVRDSAANRELGVKVIVVDCPVIKGDSGGPILLTEKDGTRRLIGVISGYSRSDTGEFEVSYGASAASFAAKVVSAGSTAPAAAQ